MKLKYPIMAMLILLLWMPSGCREKEQKRFFIDLMNPMTPIKDQGKSQTCWAYAMLAAIETEHISRGDSVHLSPAYVEVMMEQDSTAPKSKRGIGLTLVSMIQRYGLCAYDAMRSTDRTPPRLVFMLGAEYTPQEFARSVCAPGEWVGLMSTDRLPYYDYGVLDVPDNWQRHELYNLPKDSLIRTVVRAVKHGHGVCWEGDISELGFDGSRDVAVTSLLSGRTTDDHAMAVVGLAHDADMNKFLVMKNSWGTSRPYGGLFFLSLDYAREKTVAVFMTCEAAGLPRRRPSAER